MAKKTTASKKAKSKKPVAKAKKKVVSKKASPKKAPKKLAAKKLAAKKPAAKKASPKKAAPKVKAVKAKAPGKLIPKKDFRRIGVFGGTFNPVHLGHTNSVQTVLDKLNLDEMIVIPANVTPGRSATEGATPAERLEMAHIAFQGMSSVAVNDVEIRKGGLSYTVETLAQLRLDYSPAEFYLVIGLDQFEKFTTWKDYREVLDTVNVVVTSRPDGILPITLEDVPPELRRHIKDFAADKAELNSGKYIYFVQLEDVAVSASEVRRKLVMKKSCEGLIAPAVENYIVTNGLYSGVKKKIGDFEALTKFCANHLFMKKGIQVQAYDVRNITQPSEFVLIVSGTSKRHASSLAENLTREVKTHYGVFPQSTEGLQEGRWVVLDYGSLIVHVFYDFTRQEYRLEDLWKGGKNLNLKDPTVGQTPREYPDALSKFE